MMKNFLFSLKLNLIKKTLIFWSIFLTQRYTIKPVQYRKTFNNLSDDLQKYGFIKVNSTTEEKVTYGTTFLNPLKFFFFG